MAIHRSIVDYMAMVFTVNVLNENSIRNVKFKIEFNVELLKKKPITSLWKIS